MDLAKFLETEQDRRKLTQSEFAEQLGFSQSFFSRVINGKKKITQVAMIERIAKATGKTLDEIVRLANGR